MSATSPVNPSPATLTPMMQQYRDAKEAHPGMLLLFRMGDFYELFDSDAELASRVLGLTITSRDKTIPMAGFPHHSLQVHLRKLLQAGHRVAICDQVEDAALAKGLVRREVTRVVTPGTLTEDELLDPKAANHLVALAPEGNLIGLAWVDLSTGEFLASDVPTSGLADELGRLAASEYLCAETKIVLGGSLEPSALAAQLHALSPEATLVSRPDWSFERTSAQNALFDHLGVVTMAGFGFSDDQPGLTAAGALLRYLKETLKCDLSHLKNIRPYRQDEFLVLDEVTRRSLELTRTLREENRAGSLLWVLDRSVTPMGARLIKHWLESPLANRGAIDSRLDAVAELAEGHHFRQELRDRLAETLDLQRLTARISTGRASPRDLGGVGRTLRVLPPLKAKVAGRRSAIFHDLETRLDLCPDLRAMLDGALSDELPLGSREGGVIRRGHDVELDHWHSVAKGGKEWIAQFQAREIARTGIPSLKVGFNRVFGYYIEITHVRAKKVPDDYQRKQTLKNAERYITPELKEYEEKVLSAEDKIREREHELFVALRDQVAAQSERLMRTADVLATLDALGSLAEVAASRGYCRPELCEDPMLEIVEGRHPVLDQALAAGMLVPNDVHMGSDAGMVLLITGPNMSGKSVFIRQVALLTLMAQMGSFVPARRARIGIVDRIFTRVGASDELSRAQSTFMVEMTEAANILNNATPRSLVILDEIGRGTSTYDGVSIAWAIAEYLHDQVGCRALFATHYHELAQLAERLPALRNYNAQVDETEGRVIFLHRIAPGSADKSYGIHVARLAGVPGDVLDRATEVLADLEAHHVKTKDPTISKRPRRAPASQGPGLFG
jgi:DNA mismatch repair protein MutS